MSRRPRYGFTLVELLVVIAIIGVLVALLLPAVQMAREAARRSDCTNKLKQIGLGLQGYLDGNKAFPPGIIALTNSSNTLTSTQLAPGWAVQILPFVEERALYNLMVSRLNVNNGPTSWNGSGNGSSSSQQRTGRNNLQAFVCPSDPKAKGDIRWHSSNSGYYAGRANYIGNWGIGAMNSSGTPTGTAPAAGLANPFVGNHLTLPDPQGVLFANSSISVQRITDGTSTTFLVGERHNKYQLASNGTEAPFSGGDTTWVGAGSGDYTIDGTTASTPVDVWAPHNLSFAYYGPNRDYSRGFSSQHPGGSQFVMCDDSVHFISDTVDRNVYRRLARRNDGYPTQVP
ncbi:DUF1559 domain-containing protein [Lignipirellula cremea]|uniref:Type II secretion system protein G n=1 Tax=Lignipirellula cremea TaxID=2528010 RepID=A0A518DYM9_9BACT|nr:DUF1559 domain-containing protein [Lignipirellula cremea]QDU96946.1 Type II secretion system protein G precursor [Lignipirellula cremea]